MRATSSAVRSPAKFAAEGFTVFAGRRNGEKLVPLVQAIEAAGGRAFARSLDARQEDDIAAFLREADAEAPLEVCIFNIGANVHFSTGGHDRARIPQGLGDGLLCRAFSPAARQRD